VGCILATSFSYQTSSICGRRGLKHGQRCRAFPSPMRGFSPGTLRTEPDTLATVPRLTLPGYIRERDAEVGAWSPWKQGN